MTCLPGQIYQAKDITLSRRTHVSTYTGGPLFTLQWRHNGHRSVSNHQPHDCLLNRLFRRRSKKTSKLRVTGLCAENSLGTGEFPAQMASYAENVSIWWRHNDWFKVRCIGIPIINLRRSDDHLRFLMWIPLSIRGCLRSKYEPKFPGWIWLVDVIVVYSIADSIVSIQKSYSQQMPLHLCIRLVSWCPGSLLEVYIKQLGLQSGRHSCIFIIISLHFLFVTGLHVVAIKLA